MEGPNFAIVFPVSVMVLEEEKEKFEAMSKDEKREFILDKADHILATSSIKPSIHSASKDYEDLVD